MTRNDLERCPGAQCGAWIEPGAGTCIRCAKGARSGDLPGHRPPIDSGTRTAVWVAPLGRVPGSNEYPPSGGLA